MRVIITRPRIQAAEWVERLKASAIDAVALPLIDIAAPADLTAVSTMWDRLAEHRLVVFVSPNAVTQFFAARPAGTTWPASTLATSPGPGTTQALIDFGIPEGAIVTPPPDSPQFDSEAVWAALAAVAASSDWHWRGMQVLIVRGDGGRDWLGDTLKAHGASVSHLSAYRRVAPDFDAAQCAVLRQATQSPERHVWLFSSSEAVERLAAAHGANVLADASAIATHPRIAARVRQLVVGRVIESRPTFDAVVACLESIRL